MGTSDGQNPKVASEVFHSVFAFKRLFARMTFCRMSRALLVQMNGLGFVASVESCPMLKQRGCKTGWLLTWWIVWRYALQC